MKIGIESYSYHRYFGETTPFERPVKSRRTIFDFVERAQDLEVNGVSLETCYFPSLDQDVLVRLRTVLDAAGLKRVLAWGHPEGLQMGRSPNRITELQLHFESARKLGATVMRVVAGNPSYRGQEEPSRQIERLAPILKKICEQASESGLRLAIENHADFTSHELLDLIERVGHKRLFVTFDTANALRVGEDPVEAVTQLAQHIICVHLKDAIVLKSSIGNPGAFWPSTPLGRGEVDLRAVLTTLSKAGFDGLLCIEMANLHPDWPDEDAAVAESVTYLKGLLSSLQPSNSPGGRNA
jgi:sugar phosphate isomerase/epimerase